MLRKLFAKLRKTLGPDEKTKPSHERSEHPTRKVHSAHSQTHRDRSKSGPRAKHEGHHEPDHGKGGHGSHGGHGGSGSHGSRRGEPRASSAHSHESTRGGGRGHTSARGRGRAHAHEEESAPKAEHKRTPRKTKTAVTPIDSAFSRLGLSPEIAVAVHDKGYTEPTPIQAQAIPVVLSGRDLIGSAQTGTGKTAAFALPILQRLGDHGRLRCLVLEPTRELALQVEEAFKEYSKYTDLEVTVVYGGVGYGKQRDDLTRGVDILAATPGRLLDHLEQGLMTLDDIEILVLDEVDRMLDMGFLPDVKRIVQKCPKSRQTLFFTATLPPEIASLAGWALREPAEVNIGQRRSPAETVAHAFYPVVDSQKFDLLEALLKQTDFKSVIVFARTKFGADRIARRLEQAGHSVGVIHSARSQRERVDALTGFKNGKFEVLVATDIAARGLDIAGVSHVVNYDVPENPEDYVHRIGRTGRAQTTGDAFTLVTEDDVRNARSIERYIGASIERKKIEGFNYIYSALFDENSQTAAAPKPASRLHRGGRR
jgi:ATP-dependent RNA helicase RhlE